MNIPGWFDWPEIYDAFVAEARPGAHVVECGTFFGASAHYLASRIQASGKAIRFDTWDTWLGVPPGCGWPGWQGPEPLTEARARDNLLGLPVRVCTGDALAAAATYQDGSLDLVFLDDDHTTAHVRAECAAWWPKVTPGGVLAGHDWHWPSVREGVEAWAEEAGVVPVPVPPHAWRVRK